jgi:hexosaminidase
LGRAESLFLEPAMSDLFRAATPAVPIRGVHLDLKGLPPTFERLLSLLDLLVAARYNCVLAEWEDTFPWTVDERFRCETAYTPEQIRSFGAAAAERGIEVISLVQCLGHMETPLSVAGYERLREVPDRSDVLNPLASGARELVQAMVDDVLALTPEARWLHLGGDEAWSFGTHPDCAAFIAQHGKGALYLHHVEPILDALNARGVRPILWHDMMLEWDDAAIKRLAAKADLCVWGYGGHPDRVAGHFATHLIKRFADLGVTLWGATAYKGADGHNVDLPVLANRLLNATGWAEVAARFGAKGVFATAWSRYSTQDVACEPIDGALDSLVAVGVALHDAQLPAGGREACVAALEAWGEGERFAACHTALAELAEARRWGWTAVQQWRECEVTARLDPRRRGAQVAERRRADVERAIQRLEAVGAGVEAALAGLVPQIWVERYVAERVEAVREAAG